MSRPRAPLQLDDDPTVTLTLEIPASLQRTLHLYCLYREHDERKIPKAATAAIAAYFASDTAFKTWRREHADIVVPPPALAGFPRSRRQRPSAAVSA